MAARRPQICFLSQTCTKSSLFGNVLCLHSISSGVPALFSERAFIEACLHGTRPSYRARINIIGHSGAGKTSLTRRLLGKSFQRREKTTEGIATHRVEFVTEESAKQTWTEAELDTEDLVREFCKEVSLKIQQPGIYTQHNAASPQEKNPEASPSSSKNPSAESSSDGALSETSPLDQPPKLEMFEVNPELLQQAMSGQEDLEPKEKKSVIQRISNAVGLSKASDAYREMQQVGVLQLWDFGGQTEFYTTHHMFMDAQAVNIVVMDISKQLSSEVRSEGLVKGIPSTAEDFFCYWLRSIQNQADEKRVEPTVLLVLTHKDQISSRHVKSHIDSFKLVW